RPRPHRSTDMPKAPRRCPSPGCTELIRYTKYCEQHTPKWDNPSGWTKPQGWNILRTRVLERDHWTCYLCGRPGADTVDHITPLSRGGTNLMSNLAAVHDRNPPHCHRSKTASDRATRGPDPSPAPL